MKTIRQQAESMGHPVVGTLKRIEDDVFYLKGKKVRHRRYEDSENTIYAVDSSTKKIAYICGDTWVI